MVVGAVGVAVAASSLESTPVPLWVTIIGYIAVPTVTLIGILLTYLHQNQKIDDSRRELGTKLDVQKIEIDGKMEQLLELTRTSAHAAGLLEGLAAGVHTAELLKAAQANDIALRAEGAADLLKTQAKRPTVAPDPL